MKFFTKFKNAVKSKIVGKRVNDTILAINKEDIDRLANSIGDGFKESTQQLIIVLADLVINNRENIVKLAEDNANQVIKLAGAIETLTEVAKEFDTQDNKATLKAMLGVASETIDAYSESLDEVMVPKSEEITEQFKTIATNVKATF